MGGPPPVRLLEKPDWAIALCERIRGAAGALLGADPPPPVPPPGSDRNPLSLERARTLFADMRAADIPFDFAKGYCSARAHEMRRLMAAQGVECRKVFFHAAKDHSIRVEHPTMGTILWAYHVAPTVAVQTPDGVVRMVIDPSLFDGPVTIEEWTGVMSCEKAVIEQTPGAIYQPFDARDDDYRQTERLLEEARVVAEAWRRAGEEMGRADLDAAARAAADEVLAREVGPASWEEDGIVPDEDSAEDDDDIERTA
jgi:Glutaminase